MYFGHIEWFSYCLGNPWHCGMHHVSAILWQDSCPWGDQLMAGGGVSLTTFMMTSSNGNIVNVVHNNTRPIMGPVTPVVGNNADTPRHVDHKRGELSPSRDSSHALIICHFDSTLSPLSHGSFNEYHIMWDANIDNFIHLFCYFKVCYYSMLNMVFDSLHNAYFNKTWLCY